MGYTPRYTMKNLQERNGVIHVIHANGLWNNCDNVIIEILLLVIILTE